ncbi:MAG: DNA-directed RNA polymerase subunit A'', partial [Brevinematia bacterium]
VYEKIKVDPGEPVGIVTAQSLAEPTTQMILRSFHFVGIAEQQVSLGLPRLIEITDAIKKISKKYMKIRLVDEYKHDEEAAIRLANKIKEVLLEDLVSSISLDILENTIYIELDEEKMKANDVDKNTLYKMLKKKLKKFNVTMDKNIIKIHSEKAKPSHLYMIKENIKKILVKGIKGIKSAEVVKEGDEWIIFTIGSNLAEVIRLPEVDYTRVYTNDIREIEKVLGIEAARNAILNEIYTIYKEQGLEVNFRHFMLVADLLTWYGEYLGITRYGIHAKKESVLSKAAFEIPITIFIKASIVGEKDKIISGIDNVLINQPIYLGTGLYSVHYSGKGGNKE